LHYIYRLVYDNVYLSSFAFATIDIWFCTIYLRFQIIQRFLGWNPARPSSNSWKILIGILELRSANSNNEAKIDKVVHEELRGLGNVARSGISTAYHPRNLNGSVDLKASMHWKTGKRPEDA
jgi:hypothetical protein